jgi:hypothetical protein
MSVNNALVYNRTIIISIFRQVLKLTDYSEANKGGVMPLPPRPAG